MRRLARLRRRSETMPAAICVTAAAVAIVPYAARALRPPRSVVRACSEIASTAPQTAWMPSQKAPSSDGLGAVDRIQVFLERVGVVGELGRCVAHRLCRY